MSMFQEDVFSLYERNRSHHNGYCLTCTDETNQCECESKHAVYPICIGEQDIPCRFHVRNYIKIGDDCPICFDSITHKIDAYITGCGHSFHRKCLFNVFHARWKQRPFSQIKCPLCRCGLGCPDLFQRYNYCTSSSLDILENFWMSKDYMMPEFCPLFGDNPHYLGMHTDCGYCTRYRNIGYYLC